jgi:hypothetical protein
MTKRHMNWTTAVEKPMLEALSGILLDPPSCGPEA